jgi:integrase/recombinase XerD
VTPRRHDLAAEIYHIKEPIKLPLVMSPNKAERLLAMAGAFGYGCGLRAGEIVRLKAGDIDSAQNVIRIVRSKGRKDRHVMLPPEVLNVFRQWRRPSCVAKGQCPTPCNAAQLMSNR